MKPPRGVQAVRTMQVLVIEEAVGNGKDDPLRPIYSYWTMGGELIYRNDPLESCPTSGQNHPGLD